MEQNKHDQHLQDLPLEDPDEAMLQDQEKKMKTISKKGVTFSNFKMHKKLAQGIKVLCKIEDKKFGDMVTQNPTKNLMILHFGSGDEADYDGLSKFLESFGKNTLHIFPGIPYGMVEFETLQQAEELIKATTKVPDNIVANSCEVNFGQKVRNVFFFYTNLGINQLQRQKQTDIPDGSTTIKVPGLEVIHDFVTPEEEQELMKEIDKNKWHPLAQRRVQHYGYEFIYGANSVNKDKHIGPLPDFIPNITDRVNKVGEKYNKKSFDQLTINDYFPGQGIPPHVDTHSPFEECLVSLSLGSGVVMTFKDDKNVSKHIFLPARSLAVFTAEARYAFYHSIATRKLDRVDGALFFRRRRISLTYRTVKYDECRCKWPIFCDSQSTKPLPAFQEFKKEDKEGNDAEPEEIEIEEGEEHKASDKTTLSEWEKKYVYGTYEKIAPHFSSTRYKPWPKIAKFLTELPFGSLVADVGCGNGKYLPVNQENLYTIGTDRSENLIEICKNRDRTFQVFSSDSLRLPFRNECVDCAISIAVIHHFSNKKLRIQAIKELARITKKGGKILIYVWAFEQDGKKFTQQDVLIPWHLQFKFEDTEKINNLLSEKTETGSNVGEGSQKGNKSEVGDKEEEKKEGSVKEESVKEGSVKDGEDDCHVNEAKKTVVYKRYYHMFKNGELEELIKEIPELEIDESFYDHANWCVKLRKVGN